MKGKILFLFILLVFVCPAVLAQNGLVQTYFGNGGVESEVFYVKDAIDGVAKWYYENGVLKEEKSYMLGKLNGWVRTYYENSAPKEEYFIKDGRLDGLYKTYYDNGGIKSISTFENGLRKDVKNFAYDKTLQPPKIESVKKEEPVQVVRNETNSVSDSLSETKNDSNDVQTSKDKLKSDQNEEEYLIATEQKPEPIGGIPAIMDKVKYPLLAKQAKVEGEVIVRAYVNEIGLVTATQILKGLGFGCDEVAMDAVKKTPFRPGKQNGKAVKVQLDVPVKFTLGNVRS